MFGAFGSSFMIANAQSIVKNNVKEDTKAAWSSPSESYGASLSTTSKNKDWKIVATNGCAGVPAAMRHNAPLRDRLN